MEGCQVKLRSCCKGFEDIYVVPGSLCNKRHELAENFLSLILINLVPKVASNCE